MTNGVYARAVLVLLLTLVCRRTSRASPSCDTTNTTTPGTETYCHRTTEQDDSLQTPPSSSTTVYNNSVCDGLVHELDLDNFESVVTASSFTFLLFYDAHDISKELEQKRLILQRLAESCGRLQQPKAFFWRNIKLRFAVIDSRRHNYLRNVYLRWSGAGVGREYERFHENWDHLDEHDSPIPSYMQDHHNANTEFVPNHFEPLKADESGENFYKYGLDTTGVLDETDAELMKALTYPLGHFMAWTNSYESLWTERRRKFMDERTNYGLHLKEMHDQFRDILLTAVDENGTSELEEDFSFTSSEDIPNLANYYEDMVFGFGRSPSALMAYLEENLYASKTSEEIAELALFDRIREYMKIREVAGQREPYTAFFRAIWVKTRAVLANFQLNLARDYVQYLESHPDEKEHPYTFSRMDVIDMQDPNNVGLLSDYDTFQSQYIAQRKPFVLANVNMTTPSQYTLDYLVEKCGHVDVTNSVKMSMKMGDKTTKGWGGLRKFVLPQQYMKNRQVGYGEYDQTISLEQFVALMKRDETLYLHDFGIKNRCSSLFWDKMPYGQPSGQLFRIPSVIGRYDLFQRLPQTGYSDSWPSLFIGREGSNSKLHIDSGGTGFWMYLVSGRKRWVVYDEAERPLLYERIGQSSFIADVLALNSTENDEHRRIIHEYFDATHPLLRLANGYEIIQEPGQLVYIPPDSPHAVENLSDVVGISFNQVPKSGIGHHLHSLIHDRREFGSLEIALRFLVSDEVRRSSLTEVTSSDQLYTTLGEYVAQ